MDLVNFDYDLPKRFIADRPLQKREMANLMVVDRTEGTFGSLKVYELVNILKSGDVLVLNNTKLFPARLFGEKESGGKIELLLIKEIDGNWECCGAWNFLGGKVRKNRRP